MYHIFRLTHPSPEHLARLEALYRQLSPGTSPAIDLRTLARVCEESVAYVATHAPTQELVAFALLIPGRKPADSYAQIHDVIVDENHRGKQHGRTMSIAEEIMRHLIDEARALNTSYIELTSRPERIAANCLYQKLGFTKIAEGVVRSLYRLYLDTPSLSNIPH